MFFGLYQLIVGLSAGASACLWIIRPTRPVFGFAGAGGWAIAALSARTITLYSGGSAFSAGSEAFQYFSLGLAVLNLATVVLWYLGVYPPVAEDDSGTAEIPGEQATMEGDDV